MLRLPRFARVSLLLSTLVAATAISQAVVVREAHADSKKKKSVAVGAFEGAKSDDVRSSFIEALKADGSFEVTDAEDVKAGKAKAIADSAKGLAVDAVITGKVSKGFALKLKVHGANGKVIDEVDVKGGALPKLKANIEKTGIASVAAVLGVAKEEEPKEEEKPAEEEKKEDEEKPADNEPAAEASVLTDDLSGKGLSPFDATAGLRPMHRTFTFHDTLADVRPNDNFSQLLRYELPLGPVIFVDLNFFPGSLVSSGPAEWFGLTGGFEKGFATQSVYAEGKPEEKTLKTNEQQWYIGGRFRFPLAAHQLGLIATYGQHNFSLSGDEDRPLVPDVKYTNIRVGLDGTFRFGDFLAGARVGKRFVTSTGQLESLWFPNVKTSSLEAGVTVGYRLISVLDLVGGFDWLRYAFDFNPVPMRPADQLSFVAGGAVDEYFVGHIAFRFHMPGKGEGAPAE